MTKLTAFAVGIALCATGALGQSRSNASSQLVFRVPRPNPGFSPNGRRSLIGLSGVPLGEGARHHRSSRNSFYYGGWPYWPSEDQESYESQQPIQVEPAPMSQPKSEPPLQPALYELRESHWVRLNFGEASASSTSPAPQPFVPAITKELPPAILVFHDGHTEELSSYSIIGVTLYTKADYWTSGAWTRKIQIADLDLPATLKQNHDRGLAFQLPSGPDEVILRP